MKAKITKQPLKILTDKNSFLSSVRFEYQGKIYETEEPLFLIKEKAKLEKKSLSDYLLLNLLIWQKDKKVES